MVLAQLFGTIVGGLVAASVGLRVAAFLGPVFALLGAMGLYLSPVWKVRQIARSPVTDGADPGA